MITRKLCFPCFLSFAVFSVFSAICHVFPYINVKLVKTFDYCSLLDQILIVLSMSTLKTLNHLSFIFCMEFRKDLSWVLYYSTCTPLLSVLSYLILQQTSMLTILNFFYHSQLLIYLKTSLTLKTL